MNRVLVIGTTGSGKTTLASAVAAHLGAPHVELDGLHWKSGWVEADAEEFRALALRATEGPRWVACGNYYRRVGEALWERADTIVWLDLALPLLLWRVVARTISRSLRRTPLWGGNTERISSLWRKDSLVLWAIQSHPRNRARYAAAFADPRWRHLTLVRLRSRRAARAWLHRLRAEALGRSAGVRP